MSELRAPGGEVPYDGDAVDLQERSTEREEIVAMLSDADRRKLRRKQGDLEIEQRRREYVRRSKPIMNRNW